MSMSKIHHFACPVHKTEFGENFHCPKCDMHYPVINDIPVLLNEANSVFRLSDYCSQDQSYSGATSYAGSQDSRKGLRQFYRRMMFGLSESVPHKRDFDVGKAVDHILNLQPHAKILVIGAGDTKLNGDVTYSDVAFGKNVACIADAHDLPFLSGAFDACVVSAVLEHVVDPFRCVQEIMRILRPQGYVFAETPFMYPVHMREYDFTRFTHMGHRRLFRYFDEIRSGMSAGAGVSLSHICRYAITSLSDRPGLKKWLKMIGLLTTYPLRWLDCLSYDTNSAYDSAAGFYFFGTLRDEPIPDRELLKTFRGG